MRLITIAPHQFYLQIAQANAVDWAIAYAHMFQTPVLTHEAIPPCLLAQYGVTHCPACHQPLTAPAGYGVGVVIQIQADHDVVFHDDAACRPAGQWWSHIFQPSAEPADDTQEDLSFYEQD